MFDWLFRPCFVEMFCNWNLKQYIGPHLLWDFMNDIQILVCSSFMWFKSEAGHAATHEISVVLTLSYKTVGALYTKWITVCVWGGEPKKSQGWLKWSTVFLFHFPSAICQEQNSRKSTTLSCVSFTWDNNVGCERYLFLLCNATTRWKLSSQICFLFLLYRFAC